MGQTARVKVIAIDEDNKIKLSKKALEYNSYRRSDPLAPKPKKPHFHRNRNHKDKF